MNGILPVFRRNLRDSWRSLLGWTVGLAAVLFLYLPLYPSLGGNGQLQDIISALPKELVETIGYDQISSGAGYTQSTFYGLMGFLLLTIAAVIWGLRRSRAQRRAGAQSSTSRTASDAVSTLSSRRSPSSSGCSGSGRSRGSSSGR